MLKPKSLHRTYEELKLLGLHGSAYRIAHEIGQRSGFTAVMNPIRKRTGHEKRLMSLSTWRREKRSFFIPDVCNVNFIKWFDNLYEERGSETFLRDAESILDGKILCFSRWVGDFGSPPDWHMNPIRKVSWPANVHSSKVMPYEETCGDIKLTWEANRFPHAYSLVRAYVLTNDSKWIACFSQQLESWERANPYRAGINWSSGQELAIRALAWIFTLYVFGNNNVLTDDDFQRLQRQLYLHAEHIENNISFSLYAVHNNHLIGEALGLYAIGSLFPWFDKSEKWRRIGKELLTGKCLRQFYADGGYIQLSHNYHRLALHYYIWAIRVAESLGEQFPQELYDTLERSGTFLASFMNSDGRLPNWGANDGAYLNPLSQCDYADFRPLLNVIRFMTRGVKAFEHGPWDEELLWFCGPVAVEGKVEPYVRKSAAYAVTGLHVLREDEGSFIAFRCGSVRDRFGQADQLHADIWWRGQNIAVDGGSYLYNDELSYHHYFMGTRSHNTVAMDETNQMYLHRRFKWLNWTKATLLKFNQTTMLEGEHYGYERLKDKIIHRRKIEIVKPGSYLIQDHLIQECRGRHSYTLHWLISDYAYKILEAEKERLLIEFNTLKGFYYLGVKNEREAEYNIVKAYEDPEQGPWGWHSRYYGEKLPALSISLSCSSDDGAAFSSIFTDDMLFLRDHF